MSETKTLLSSNIGDQITSFFSSGESKYGISEVTCLDENPNLYWIVSTSCLPTFIESKEPFTFDAICLHKDKWSSDIREMKRFIELEDSDGLWSLGKALEEYMKAPGIVPFQARFSIAELKKQIKDKQRKSDMKLETIREDTNSEVIERLKEHMDAFNKRMNVLEDMVVDQIKNKNKNKNKKNSNPLSWD